jgi:phage terminase Nu1 subunit (DNA packaging protein)
MARSGIRDELAKYPESLREPVRLHREEAVYDALLAALDSGSLVVTGDLRCVLRDLAETIDRANEYERVVAEHAALLGLRKQICEGASYEPCS